MALKEVGSIEGLGASRWFALGAQEDGIASQPDLHFGEHPGHRLPGVPKQVQEVFFDRVAASPFD